MAYTDAFRQNTDLIQQIGEGNAYLVWVLGLYLDESDLPSLASEALTDGSDDKKIDFIYLDRDSKQLIFAQGYYTTSVTNRNTAPANKASDLNTAAAWLLSGDLSVIPSNLRSVIQDVRQAMSDGEIEEIDLLYVHNLPESIPVSRELQTVAAQFRLAIGEQSTIRVVARELGISLAEQLFRQQDSQILVKDEITLPAKERIQENGPKWSAQLFSVSGDWLHKLYEKHGDALFSANYRDFLGVSKRKRINSGIRQSAEQKPLDFWVFNNGITILTMNLRDDEGKGVILSGVSIINGAQTTGSIGIVDATKANLSQVKVLCRVIQCNDEDTVSEIVKYNNTQNAITTWDQYSNDSEQNRLELEFKQLGFAYCKKRGFRTGEDQIGIEEVAQPLLAFKGLIADATRGKNLIFERKALYKAAFEGKKATHILYIYTLARAIDSRRLELKERSNEGSIIGPEISQLSLMRHLKFKSFLIAIVARVLESILQRPIDKDTIGFTAAGAMSPDNSLISLGAAWSPVVEAVLTFLSSTTSAEDIGENYSDEKYLDMKVRQISALLYASRNSLSFSELASRTSR